MKLTADRDGTSRYFCAKLGWKEQFDSKEIEILSAGAVPMLIPPVSVQGRKNNIIKYDISPYSTLEFYLSCILTRDQFAETLLQCIDVFKRMKQIYLSYKNLVFDIDKVYIQLADRTVHFVYLPLVTNKKEVSIPDFFRKMIQKASRSTYEQTSFLDACLAYLGQPSSFILSEFETFIRGSIQTESVSTPKSFVKQETADKRTYIPEPLYVSPASAREQSDRTTMLDMAGGEVQNTVLLGDGELESQTARFFLVRNQTGEKIELTRFPFVIGSDPRIAAYCVSGNMAISRRHAVFNMSNGECMIADQGSTNKTFLNSMVLAPNTEQRLADGDLVRFANENFTFVREEQT